METDSFVGNDIDLSDLYEKQPVIYRLTCPFCKQATLLELTSDYPELRIIRCPREGCSSHDIHRFGIGISVENLELKYLGDPLGHPELLNKLLRELSPYDGADTEVYLCPTCGDISFLKVGCLNADLICYRCKVPYRHFQTFSPYAYLDRCKVDKEEMGTFNEPDTD